MSVWWVRLRIMLTYVRHAVLGSVVVPTVFIAFAVLVSGSFSELFWHIVCIFCFSSVLTASFGFRASLKRENQISFFNRYIQRQRDKIIVHPEQSEELCRRIRQAESFMLTQYFGGVDRTFPQDQI